MLLNQDDRIVPTGDVLSSFKDKRCSKILLTTGSVLYRIATGKSKNQILPDNAKPNQFLKGAYWFDQYTFNQISSRVKQNSGKKNIGDHARDVLAITTKMNVFADSLISICLKEDVYAWRGFSAKQEEVLENGLKIQYPGGLSQLWIPNLTPAIANYRFYYSI